MKVKFLYILFIFIYVSFNANSQGIGVVSRTTIYQSMPQFMKDLKYIDSTTNAYAKEMDLASSKLQSQVMVLIKSYQPAEKETLEDIKKRMAPKDTLELKKLFDEDKELKKKQDIYDTKLAKLQSERITPVMKSIDDAIKAIGVKENLDAIYFFEDIANGLAFFNEKRNYTELVIEMIKKKK